MGRQERRRQQKEQAKDEARYYFTESELTAELKRRAAREIEEEGRKIRKWTTEHLIGVFVQALYLETGWGKKRIQRVVDRARDQFLCIKADTVTIQDIKQDVESREVNIDVENLKGPDVYGDSESSSSEGNM